MWWVLKWAHPKTTHWVLLGTYPGIRTLSPQYFEVINCNCIILCLICHTHQYYSISDCQTQSGQIPGEGIDDYGGKDFEKKKGLIPWLHVKCNYSKIISAFVDIRLK